MMANKDLVSNLPEYQSRLQRTHIRLLNLHARDESEGLRCHLETVLLTNSVAYEAISYVWGDENDRRPLEIVRHDGVSVQISITLNLGIALSQFRQDKARRRLWVDSVCINQNDIQERNEQVIMMGEIYRNAQKVLISLGDDGVDNSAASAVRCMQSLIQAEENHDILRGNKSSKTSWVRADGDFSAFFGLDGSIDMGEKLDIPPLASPEFQSLTMLFQCPWFSRAWTWQESHLAKEKTFHWGGESWPGTLMPKILRILSRLRLISGNEAYQFSELIRAAPMLASLQFWKGTRQLEFLTILSVRRASGCKFPSDLVYSLLGAATRRPAVKVDYDLPFESVFTQVAKSLIDEYENFSILGLIDGPRQSSTLPSWVPDWRERMATTGMTGISDSARSAYKVDGKPIVKLLPDGRTLEAEGILLDTIVAIRESSISENEFIANNFETTTYSPTDEPIETALWRSRCRDINLFEPDRLRTRWDSQVWDRMQKISANAHDVPGGRREYAAMITAIVEANRDTVLFKTLKGYLGFGHQSVRKDDVVVRLFGGQYPLVLRPADSNTKYTLVSESYVHGLMDGESPSEQDLGLDDADMDQIRPAAMSGCLKFQLI